MSFQVPLGKGYLTFSEEYHLQKQHCLSSHNNGWVGPLQKVPMTPPLMVADMLERT